MKTSINRINIFQQGGATYLTRHQGETKPSYTINQIGKQISKIAERFRASLREEFDDIRVDHCKREPPNDLINGILVRDAEGRLAFTAEGEKACQRAIKAAELAAMDREDYEINPYYFTQIPDDLTEEELRAFSGFVIKPEQVEEILREREVKLSIVPKEEAA